MNFPKHSYLDYDEHRGSRAVGYLIKHNTLARAIWSACNTPGNKMQEKLMNKSPLPAKVLIDENVLEDSDDDLLELEKANGGINNFKKPEKEFNVSNNNLKDIIKLLEEILKITKEQSEFISSSINEANIKYFQQYSTQ